MDGKGLAGRLAGILILIAAALPVAAQELACTVEVNSESVEGTNKSVFETLQSAMSAYMNETRFGNAEYARNERIECRMFLTVKEYADDRVKGELQLQLQRPVYNSSYQTTLFNFRDTRVEFGYREGDPLIYNENSEESNLTALLDYYALLFLAIDSDSFAPHGGDRYFDRAATVVQRAQSGGEIGWRAFEDTRNRASVLGSYTDASTSRIRDLLYNYHRLGLDQMATTPDKGRAVITESLDVLREIYDKAPMSVTFPIFSDAKLDELVNIYSKAPESERRKVYDLLKNIYPTENERLDKIRNPER